MIEYQRIASYADNQSLLLMIRVIEIDLKVIYYLCLKVLSIVEYSILNINLILR